jgi:hypothetical protein
LLPASLLRADEPCLDDNRQVVPVFRWWLVPLPKLHTPAMSLTLLPLMLLLLTCSDIADEDHNAPPSWSAVLLEKVQLLK